MGRNNTQFFHVVKEQEYDVASILKDVYEALTEKGYNPVNQIVGYIMSGDPTYITSHMKERWMGLDYGTKTVGVAVSDVLGITAQGVETVTRKSNKKLRQTLARIEALIEEYEVSKVVLGLPKNMNNTLGERAEETKEFQAMLQRRTGLEVVLWDERLTTMESERILQEGGVRRENRKERIDWMAATLILQSYMDAHPIPEK